jgi:hypothetical protein
MSDETKVTSTTSLAVRQFCDLAFGWVPVHRPSTPFKVEAVMTEQRYCLGCCGVRWFDVVRGTPPLAPPQMGESNLEMGKYQATFCRCCGMEV